MAPRRRRSSWPTLPNVDREHQPPSQTRPLPPNQTRIRDVKKKTKESVDGRTSLNYGPANNSVLEAYDPYIFWQIVSYPFRYVGLISWIIMRILGPVFIQVLTVLVGFCLIVGFLHHQFLVFEGSILGIPLRTYEVATEYYCGWVGWGCIQPTLPPQRLGDITGAVAFQAKGALTIFDAIEHLGMQSVDNLGSDSLR
jgi:hypothetical protein